MKTLSKALALSLLALPVLADSPATPWRHVVASGDKFVLVMDPGNFDDVPAKGIAYKATQDGFKKMWSLEGWYEFPGDVLLSSDGKSVARIREGYLKQDGSFTDDGSKEILTIFRRGERVAGYTAQDLIKDLKEGIRFDSSGMKWVDRRDGFLPRIASSEWHHVDTVTKGETTSSSYPDVLQLTTLEGTAFLFDLKNGSILSRRAIKQEEPEESEDVDPFAAAGDPFKTTQAEQDGTEQPATSPESKPEGSDKPKPEAEGRAR